MTDKETKPMEILVVEDSPIHQESVSLLTDEGHSVDLATNFVDAAKHLGWTEYGDPERELKQYDAVLTDLMFPLGEGIVGMMPEGEIQRRHEQPLGYALVLYAAQQGVPLIGVLTDMNHHTGPIAATFDLFYAETKEELRPVFRINNSRVQLFDERDIHSAYCLTNRTFATKSPHMVGKEARADYVRRGEHGCVTAKNWKSLLDKLTEKD